MGARAYRYLELYDPSPGCLIEVGSERGEGSTRWLADYARRHGLRFYTADIDPDSHRRAARVTSGARLMPGTALLKRVGDISVAYLDGFDWIPDGAEGQGWVHEQVRRYGDLGYDMNNHNCQREHLAEAQLVADKATERCVVILDDTFKDDRRWSGKGALAVPYLQRLGFRVAFTEPRGDQSLGAVVMRR